MYEVKPSPEAIYEQICGLLCYHAILYKEVL